MKVLCVLVFLGIFSLPLLEANDEESQRSLSREKRGLFFPRFTVYQISLCLVAQVSSIPSHRVAINSGFQINYDLPYLITNFVNPMFWARALTNVSSPVTDFIEKMVKSEIKNQESGVVDGSESDVDDESDDESEDDNEIVSDDNTTVQEDSETTTEVSTSEKSKRKRKPKAKREASNLTEQRDSSDLTAGQFYSGLRETLS